MTAVHARALTRTFGAFTAVDGVSFDVAAGEIFGFLGPNGAGKTTTIKMLAGLLAPTAGEATIAGHDVYTARDAIKRQIGYMSQRFSLYADLTVAENIEFFSRLNGVPRARRAQRRAWALASAQLAEHRERLTAELPLGWKQRLALACAMLHEPPILFLDEPTSGVDPIARRAFWDVIDELAGAGTTVFVSTHYMEEAEYCDRLAMMNRGALIALDTPAQLRAALREPLLRVDTERAAEALAALEGAPGVIDAAMFGRALHVVVVDEAAGREVVRARLRDAGLAAGAIERIAPSLEDVFVALVRRAGGAPVE